LKLYTISSRANDSNEFFEYSAVGLSSVFTLYCPALPLYLSDETVTLVFMFLRASYDGLWPMRFYDSVKKCVQVSQTGAFGGKWNSRLLSVLLKVSRKPWPS